MLDMNQKELIAQSHCWTAEIEQRHIHMLYAEKNRPFMHLQPRLFIDGDKWCALYGENLQDGVCGFGDSPAEAANAFDKAWGEKLLWKDMSDALAAKAEAAFEGER